MSATTLTESPAWGESLAIDAPIKRAIVSHAHFVGLAGSGMRALAEVLRQRGWHITGSESSVERAAGMRAAGFESVAGHRRDNVPLAADLVVYSAAVPRDNPERVRAAELGIPTFRYAEMLGRLMTGSRRLAVAGTHGKSTVAAMAAEILRTANLPVTAIYGASNRCPAADRTVGATPGARGLDPAIGTPPAAAEIQLVEACEYRESFLSLRPNRAVITGIEADHFDCFRDTAALRTAFRRFVRLLPAEGLLVVPADSAAVNDVAASAACRIATFGLGPGADWRAVEIAAQNGRRAFTIVRRGRVLGRVVLRVIGQHEVQNALAAAALADSAGAGSSDILAGLARFGGLKRRLEPLGRCRGVTWWDDYAHHPTAVTAAIAALREAHGGGRLWVVFEPHQVSRTARLLDEFAESLSRADRVAIAEIYRAREEPAADDVSAADLAERTRRHGIEVFSGHRLDEIARHLRAACRRGDVVVTMGAGEIGKLSHALRNGL